MEWPDLVSVLLCCAQSLEKAEVELKNTADRKMGTYVKLGAAEGLSEEEFSDSPINA